MCTDRFVSRNERSNNRYPIFRTTPSGVCNFFLKKRTRGSSVLIKRRSKASKINFDQSSIASDSNTEVAPLIGVIFVPDALIRIVSFVDGSEKRYTLIVR